MQFGSLGGVEEVALASQCTFFWTDGAVGAWWLSVPFGRPVLFTNQYHLPQSRGTMPKFHMVLPTRYRHHDGSEMSLHETLTFKGKLFKSVQRGELVRVRNSQAEITAACAEMLARVEGTWVEDPRGVELQSQAEEIYRRFPQLESSKLPSTFLVAHPHFVA